LIIVDVSASTGAFVGTVCLIAVRKSAVTDHAISLNHVIDWDQAKVIDRESNREQSGQMDQGGDTYQEGARQVDEQRRGVLPTLPHLRQPVRPETEWRTAIRQTVPTKAPVEAKTSTIIINKKLFLMNIILNYSHFVSYKLHYYHICDMDVVCCYVCNFYATLDSIKIHLSMYM